MGLKEQIDGYTTRVDAVAAEISSELQTLNDKLAAASAPQPVDPVIQASLDALGTHLSTLEGVEQPSVPPVDTTTPGTVVDPGSPAVDPGSSGGVPATDSPGEPQPVDPTPPILVDPTAPPVPAGDLPPETPVVPAGSVDSGTVAPDAPVSSAGDVPPDASVIPVIPPTESTPTPNV